MNIREQDSLHKVIYMAKKKGKKMKAKKAKRKAPKKKAPKAAPMPEKAEPTAQPASEAPASETGTKPEETTHSSIIKGNTSTSSLSLIVKYSLQGLPDAYAFLSFLASLPLGTQGTWDARNRLEE